MHLQQMRLEQCKQTHSKPLLLRKSFVLIAFLVGIVIFGLSPIEANSMPTDDYGTRRNPTWNCKTDWFSSPNALANYLWGRLKHEVADYFKSHGLPDLTNDLQSTNSPTLQQVLNDNTDLAVQLTQVFDFGTPPASNMPANSTVDYYGLFWNPVMIGGGYGVVLEGFQRGASLQQILSCLRDEYGFDYDFISASLDYAYTKAGFYQWCAIAVQGGPAYSNNGGIKNCLDSSIYGSKPYVIKVYEPTWIFSGQHVSFFGSIQALGDKATDQYRSMRLTLDKLYGGGYTMLAIPEEVVNQVGLDEVKRTSGLYTIITFGITPSSPPHPSVTQFTQEDWAKIQQGYNHVKEAMKTYAKQKGLDPGAFTNLRRFPLDSRPPEQMRNQLIPDGFPDPVDEMADAMAADSCRVADCVLDGKAMATHYATRLYNYLMRTAMFSQQQRTDNLKAWLGNYYSADDLSRIPHSLITQKGSFLQLNYRDSVRAYMEMKSTSHDTASSASAVGDSAFQNGETGSTLFSWDTSQIIQAQPENQPQVYFTAKHVPVITPIQEPTDTASESQNPVAYQPLARSLQDWLKQPSYMIFTALFSVPLFMWAQQPRKHLRYETQSLTGHQFLKTLENMVDEIE